MSATRMRLRVVQIQVTVVTAVDTVHLPAALAREEEALNGVTS
jgi:hypothetical protein